MIIDTHVHCGIMNGFYMPNEMVEEFIDKYNVNHIILSDCRAVENTEDLKPVPPDEAYTQNEVFKDTIAFARKHPGRISVMPWIKPVIDGVDDEFINIISTNTDIVKGIKYHAYNSNLHSDSEILEPYYKIAREYRLPVVIHTGGDDASDPQYVYNAARQHPDVNFIMAHMGLTTDNLKAISFISRLPNLYGDTAWVSIKSVIKLINLGCAGKIVFGTDSPIDGPDTYVQNAHGEPSMYIDYFEKLPKLVSKEIYDKIMFKNAIRLFNLSI